MLRLRYARRWFGMNTVGRAFAARICNRRFLGGGRRLTIVDTLEQMTCRVFEFRQYRRHGDIVDLVASVRFRRLTSGFVITLGNRNVLVSRSNRDMRIGG